MATESMSDRREHVRSISVTAVAALLGVAAALASWYLTGDDVTSAAEENLPVLIVIATIFVQFPLLKMAGIYSDDEFGIKHYLFITLMTFSFWFVTWGVLLTSHLD